MSRNYRGFVKFTKAKAVALCLQQLGTARGLAADPEWKGVYKLRLGSMLVEVGGDVQYQSGLVEFKIILAGGCGVVRSYHNPDTLELDDDFTDHVNSILVREAVDEWAGSWCYDWDKCRADLRHITGGVMS